MTAVLPFPFNGRVTGAVKLAKQVLPFDEQTPRSAAAESHLVDQLRLIGHDVRQFELDVPVMAPLMIEHGYRRVSLADFSDRTYELMLGRMYLGQLDEIQEMYPETRQWLREPPLYWRGANTGPSEGSSDLFMEQQTQISRLFRSLDRAARKLNAGEAPAARELVMHAAATGRAALRVNPMGLPAEAATLLLESTPSKSDRMLAEMVVPSVLAGPATFGLFAASGIGRRQLEETWKVVLDQAPLIEPDPTFDRFSPAGGPDF